MRVWSMLLLVFAAKSYALSWNDLWATKDQQAQTLMSAQQFSQAQQTFQQGDWRAAAAYRAGDYEEAAKTYQSLPNEQGYYNLGNTLAHLQQYQQAIEAYDKALAINSHNQDAQFNRKLLAELLKKDQEQQQNQDQKDKSPQNDDQQDKNQQDKDEQNQDQQSKDQENKDQQSKDQQNQDQQSKDQQNQDRQSKDQQNKEQQEKNQQDEDKQSEKEERSKTEIRQATRQGEQRQAKEQWLRLIPDDPSGLMKEKFLRDHVRRQRGWYQ